jgi:lysyl-tRNA synthetase, class II
MSIPEFDEIIEPNDQTEARREHLEKLRELIGNAYPNKYERSRVSGDEDTITNVVNFAPVAEIAGQLKDNTPEGEKPNQELKESLNAKLKEFGNVRVSGRLAVPPRVMGKAAFVHLSDGISRLQIYVRKQDARVVSNDTGKVIEDENAAWEVFRFLDHGDFIGAEGYLFLTNTGELSVHVETFQFLSKSLLPMPDKMHGIADPELRRRYRYADLIADSLKIDHEPGELTTREVFERRARLISGMRHYLEDHGFIEVETPMLTPKATGAAAKPFKTHHDALDIPLYARIAPELYLKRLTVGGFEKVYELNRNFRNEGLSYKHNPEFTMLEFYYAYMDVNGMMDFAEAMIKDAVQKATGGSLQVEFDRNVIDFSKFERLTMKDSIEKYWETYWGEIAGENIKREWLDSPVISYQIVMFIDAFNSPAFQKDIQVKYREEFDKLEGLKDLSISQDTYKQAHSDISERLHNELKQLGRQVWSDFIYDKNMYFGEPDHIEKTKDVIIAKLFEIVAEEHLIQPTFIIDYPKSISPLSKASPENPNIAERFELFINGMECANGFSELNDPREQYERFVDQMRERETGDEEAMIMDEDYIRALAYGMPPAAGIGIGIDRFTMLLTNRHSIRDVILFPHMRPISREEGEKGREGEGENDAEAGA